MYVYSQSVYARQLEAASVRTKTKAVNARHCNAIKL